jgi:iron(III) transport system substrate-binding protein
MSEAMLQFFQASRTSHPARHLWTILALAASFACTMIASGTASAQSQKLIDAAKKEGEVVWYSSHLPPETFQLVSEAFAAKYPGMKLNIVSGASASVYQRMMQDARMKVARADVLSTATTGHFIDLKKQGMLAQYAPDNMSKVDPIFRSYGDDNYYYATEAVIFCIAYNSNKVADADAPKLWKDLLDPKWKGKIAMGSPAFSGSVAEWAAEMVKLYGWQYFETLNTQQPLIGRSVIDGVTSLVSGERMVSPTLVGVALASAKQGNPIKVVYPDEGAVLVMMPSAILKNAPHPNGARLLIEFLLEKEYAAISAQAGYQPPRSDVPPAPGSKITSEINLLTMKPQESLDGTAMVVKKWQETFGN